MDPHRLFTLYLKSMYSFFSRHAVQQTIQVSKSIQTMGAGLQEHGRGVFKYLCLYRNNTFLCIHIIYTDMVMVSVRRCLDLQTESSLLKGACVFIYYFQKWHLFCLINTNQERKFHRCSITLNTNLNKLFLNLTPLYVLKLFGNTRSGSNQGSRAVSCCLNIQCSRYKDVGFFFVFFIGLTQ